MRIALTNIAAELLLGWDYSGEAGFVIGEQRFSFWGLTPDSQPQYLNTSAIRYFFSRSRL
ncbi:MAG: hypothetical protein ANABAC_1191 [Anaerolineae bacterium]|nr:MAG: hypothetical protein ANABAC_1191 [Anaerolineae bacterium]